MPQVVNLDSLAIDNVEIRAQKNRRRLLQHRVSIPVGLNRVSKAQSKRRRIGLLACWAAIAAAHCETRPKKQHALNSYLPAAKGLGRACVIFL